MSHWADAQNHLLEHVREAERRIAREVSLRCPHCPAMNRPGATIIELETPTRAVCGVCAHAFNPQEGPA